MEFTRRKLPQEEADKLRSVAMEDVKAFVPMPAPVYVFMRQNQKFVSVKAPLDFFTPEELERLRSFGQLYFPEFVDSTAPFVRAARQVRAVLEWQPMVRSASGAQPAIAFAPASYEISDAVLRILGPLWASPAPGGTALIEPFFAALFASELCEPLPRELLQASRDRAVTDYEHALLHAGWAVFLALHLGYVNLGAINSIFTQVFRSRAMGNDADLPNAAPDPHQEWADLLSFARSSVDGREFQAVLGTEWAIRHENVAQKLGARLKRITQGMILAGAPIPTIFGERGFADVSSC